MEQLELREVYTLYSEIKQRAKKSSGITYSNLYQLYDKKTERTCCEYRFTDSSLVFSCDDEKGIHRIYFISYDLNDLEKELSYFPRNSILEYICKGDNPLKDVFNESGFEEIASYARKSINMRTEGKEFKRSHSELLDSYYDETVGEYATEEDAEEIVQLLDKVFDIEMDHIPGVEHIREYARKNWILIYRVSGEIKALYLFQIQGKKFYSNISYNSLPAVVLYCLEKRAHMDVVNNYDVAIKYSWINEKNEKSLRRNTLNFDGVYNYIYKKV